MADESGPEKRRAFENRNHARFNGILFSDQRTFADGGGGGGVGGGE